MAEAEGPEDRTLSAPFVDLSDYPMSDTFVSETRQAPYRTGFRVCRHRGKLPLKKVNTLSDQDFRRYIRNGCRFPDPAQDLLDELAQIQEAASAQQIQLLQAQEALRVQALQIQQLFSLLPIRKLQTSAKAPCAESTGNYPVKGLDVTKRD